MAESDDEKRKCGLRTRWNGDVLVATIDNTARKNALTRALWVDLADLFEDGAVRARARAVVLTGAGGDFSAGADIGEFTTLRSGASASDYESVNSAAFRAIRTVPMPTIAAIAGTCFGGGFGLAAACDLRVAGREAIFAVPAARLGLAYPCDAMSDILEAAGPQMARYLTFTGARIDTETALRCGFLLETVETGFHLERAEELALTIARNAPLSLHASKAAIRAALSREEADMVRARELGARTFASRDYQEGLSAFAGRRAPVFEGR